MEVLFQRPGQKKKRTEETEDIQQVRLRAHWKRNAAVRQLESADIRQARLLAVSNKKAAARQLENSGIWQTRLPPNRIQTAATIEQNT